MEAFFFFSWSTRIHRGHQTWTVDACAWKSSVGGECLPWTVQGCRQPWTRRKLLRSEASAGREYAGVQGCGLVAKRRGILVSTVWGTMAAAPVHWARASNSLMRPAMSAGESFAMNTNGLFYGLTPATTPSAQRHQDRADDNEPKNWALDSHGSRRLKALGSISGLLGTYSLRVKARTHQPIRAAVIVAKDR
jgi:hypothetical protein